MLEPLLWDCKLNLVPPRFPFWMPCQTLSCGLVLVGWVVWASLQLPCAFINFNTSTCFSGRTRTRTLTSPQDHTLAAEHPSLAWEGHSAMSELGCLYRGWRIFTTIRFLSAGHLACQKGVPFLVFLGPKFPREQTFWGKCWKSILETVTSTL